MVATAIYSLQSHRKAFEKKCCLPDVFCDSGDTSCFYGKWVEDVCAGQCGVFVCLVLRCLIIVIIIITNAKITGVLYNSHSITVRLNSKQYDGSGGRPQTSDGQVRGFFKMICAI